MEPIAVEEFIKYFKNHHKDVRYNLSYLCMCNGQVALKQQHQYFAQVQGEMAITKRQLCYFFVYTQKGYHLETVRFNATYWHRLEENLT